MGYSRDWRTYTDDEKNLMMALEGGEMTLPFQDLTTLRSVRHRLYALRNALLLAYDREVKGSNAASFVFSDPLVAIAPRLAQMTILIDGLNMRIGIGIMRPGVKSAIAGALASVGWRHPDQVKRDALEARKREIDAEVAALTPAGGYVGKTDEVMDGLGYAPKPPATAMLKEVEEVASFDPSTLAALGLTDPEDTNK